MHGSPTDWSIGYKRVRIITRRPSSTVDVFQTRASAAFKYFGTTLSSSNLIGLVVLSTDDYVLAVENWTNSKDYEAAAKLPEMAVVDEAIAILGDKVIEKVAEIAMPSADFNDDKFYVFNGAASSTAPPVDVDSAFDY
jgi:hypothetical protein